MCGIAGIVTRDKPLAERALRAMLCAETHRGPDDEGLELIDTGGNGGSGGGGTVVALGQRRLSIIDLSPLGHQPMHHAESGDWLTYNGELYNYMTFRRELEREGVRFRGHSDTEVMLAALVRWGPSAIERFEGMFAIIWYRAKQRTLVIARDPVGIKPLYVVRTARAFALASEVRALVESGLIDKRLDRAGLATLLAYGAVAEPHTLFEGVRSFPAGCWQEIPVDSLLDREHPAPKRYWSPPQADSSITEADATAQLRETLGDAVRDHLISDVPVGVFLSSGIDSTLLAGLAAKHLPDLRSFTVAFADNPDLSEGEMAARTAKEFGLRHTEVQITAREAEAEAAKWLMAQDQPSVDGLNVYIVSGAVKRQGMTVALSGLGGDEVFGGYPSFIDVPRLAGMMRKVRAVPRAMRPGGAAGG
ncbi:MAG TPA: asparagine synthase (glutamine-hydrolyzing), partial [Phycisphaerales bacterium]|nr:asparagine synthase (glutamine-hydrolyzing) [Phycisphaerales bacterium]